LRRESKFIPGASASLNKPAPRGFVLVVVLVLVLALPWIRGRGRGRGRGGFASAAVLAHNRFPVCARSTQKKREPDFRPAPMRTKRLNYFATALAANFVIGAAPQTYALHHTRNTAFLHLNDAIRLPQFVYRASHHFWGQRKRGMILTSYHAVPGAGWSAGLRR